MYFFKTFLNWAIKGTSVSRLYSSLGMLSLSSYKTSKFCQRNPKERYQNLESLSEHVRRGISEGSILQIKCKHSQFRTKKRSVAHRKLANTWTTLGFQQITRSNKNPYFQRIIQYSVFTSCEYSKAWRCRYLVLSRFQLTVYLCSRIASKLVNFFWLDQDVSFKQESKFLLTLVSS